MIALIRGIILEKQPPQLLIDVNGVGYEINAPMSTFYHLPDVGHTVSLHTHFIVREDAHLLFGFYMREERTLFKTLLKVNGVGPRVALTILSGVTVDEFVQAVLNNDYANLTKLPGIGKKTAERLMIEMRDKLADWPLSSQSTSTSPHPHALPNRKLIIQDAISGLISLGYKQQEANKLITKIDDGDMSSEALIRAALREMV